MHCDPVVKEVRAVRQKLFRHCHNNLDRLISFVERSTESGQDRRRATQPPERKMKRGHK